MDFYQTKYYNEYRKISKEGLKHTKNSVIHKAKPQFEYLKNISFYDNRIILDTYLDRLIYNDYYKVIKNLNEIDKNKIFNFGDTFFQKYFEMKISLCTYTRSDNISYDKDSSEKTFLVFTDNKNYYKKSNEYCIFITNDKNILNMLNNNLENKKFIGNFYYTDNKINTPTIFLTNEFLNNLKSILSKINIHNCNINLCILLSLMLFLPDKHYFDSNEVLNKWKLNSEEIKLVLFLIKKKHLIA